MMLLHKQSAYFFSGMNRSLLLLLLFFSTLKTKAQLPVKEYVQQHYSLIKSIENDSLFSGYEAIARAIGDKRVVMLGEQDHGDAPTFLAKTKIIQYLHEQKGFNVLAFESDFFALTEGQKAIMHDTASFRQYLQGNIFPIWTYCNTCTELFYHYLPATLLSNNPLTVTGFDNQVHAVYSRHHLINYMDSVISLAGHETPVADSVHSMLVSWTDSLIKNYGRYFGEKEQYERYATSILRIADQWEQQYGKDYTWQVFQSLAAFNNQSAIYYSDAKKGGGIRDAQMAMNLNWLVNEKYKSEKIIVWAANWHIIRESQAALSAFPPSMGTVFCQLPGNLAQTYIIGFTSSTGKAGRITMPEKKQYKLRKPDKDSFENMFGNAAFTFTDLSAYQQSVYPGEAFKMKVLNHVWNGKQQWARCFDGIFYIQQMYPCKPIWKQ